MESERSAVTRHVIASIPIPREVKWIEPHFERLVGRHDAHGLPIELRIVGAVERPTILRPDPYRHAMPILKDPLDLPPHHASAIGEEEEPGQSAQRGADHGCAEDLSVGHTMPPGCTVPANRF